MPADPPKSDTKLLRTIQPSPESTELQDLGRRILLAPSPAEIARLLRQAAQKYTSARAASVFFYDPQELAFIGGEATLRPEAAVIDYVFADSRCVTIPHAEGTFITVFPLRVHQERMGLLVLDVTGIAEETAGSDLEPVTLLADQAAIALQHVRLLSRTLGESTLLANILDSITNAIITLDTDRRITRINRNATAMLGVGPEAVGRRHSEVLPREVAGAVDELLAELSKAGFAMERMVAPKLDPGLELHIALSASVLRDESLMPLGTILVLRDMTASRELDRLRRLDQMKSEFVANVSHELKTPLTSIKAYTEALMGMVSGDQALQFLRVVDEESDRLIYLINDLLNVSRIQSGRMRMDFALAKPRAVAEEVLGISKVQSEKHAVTLEIADDLPEILLDREKMKEVMINLISNAIKYSPKGGKVGVRMRLEEGNLRIEVKDQGMGISKENQKKLFQAFTRVDSSNTAQIPGTGLGLVIVKAIVEAHGGKISVDSEPGRGTTFAILIPARREIRRGEAGSELGSMA